MKLRELRAKVRAARQTAGTFTGAPPCKTCPCPECRAGRGMTSDENRQRVQELLAIARARMLAAEPDLPVRELREQIAEPGFADLLARAGFILTPIAPALAAEEPS